MSAPRVHYLASSFANAAACGRYIAPWSPAEKAQHSADRAGVTCEKCKAAMQ